MRRKASTLFNGVASNEPIPFTERVSEQFPDKVVEIVKEHVARKSRDPKKLESCDVMGPGGIIIFSEYIGALDVIEMAFQEDLGRSCLRRDGTVK